MKLWLLVALGVGTAGAWLHASNRTPVVTTAPLRSEPSTATLKPSVDLSGFHDLAGRLLPGASLDDEPPPPVQTATDANKVDPEKVRAALARFHSTLQKINKEDIVEEQKEMKAAEEQMRSAKLDEPRLEDFVDQHGLHWTKLIYPSGEIRYELPN